MMDVTSSETAGKKLIREFQYIEDVDDNDTVVGRCSVGRKEKLVPINAHVPDPTLVILKRRPHIRSNGQRNL